MNFQADAMPQTVTEVLAPAGLADRVPSGRIYVPGERPGPHRLDSPALSLQHNSIQLLKFGRDRTGDHHSSQVTVIAGRVSRPPIDQKESGFADACRGRP